MIKIDDMQANEFKAQANAQFSAKNYPEASKLYGEAIALDPSNHVLYSNRSVSRAAAKDYQGALEDAEKVCERDQQRVASCSSRNSVSRSCQLSVKDSHVKEQHYTDSDNTPTPSWPTRPVFKPNPPRNRAKRV